MISFVNRLFQEEENDTVSVTFNVFSEFKKENKKIGYVDVFLSETDTLIVKFSENFIKNEEIRLKVIEGINNYGDTSGTFAQYISLKEMLRIQKHGIDIEKNGEIMFEQCRVCHYVSPSYSPEYCLSCI